MKLIDKFHKWLKTEPFNSKRSPTLREAMCVEIAENFAIEFGEWLRVECYDMGDMWVYLKDQELYTSTQILEIFKTEKEL